MTNSRARQGDPLPFPPRADGVRESSPPAASLHDRPEPGSSDAVGAFETRFGDFIDDRVAEMFDEVFSESVDAAVAARLGRYRTRAWLLAAVLTAVVTALSVALVDHPAAVATIWVAAAVISGCQARINRPCAPGR